MNPWTALGGKVYTGSNLGDDTLRDFKAIGGKWICPWVYQDQNAEENISLIPHWREQGVAVGGVFNCFAGDPETDANNITAIAKAHDLRLVILDIEVAYQKEPAKMPPLLAFLRHKLGYTYEIGVNTNSLNDSLIWNGGQLGYSQSCNNLKIRVCPQWYGSPRYAGSPWTDPVENMMWLHGDGGSRDNFHDPTQKYRRAVPLSYVHPCMEPTGVEDAELEPWLDKLVAAKKYGFTTGMNLFVLERAAADFPMMSRYRGKLWAS